GLATRTLPPRTTPRRPRASNSLLLAPDDELDLARALAEAAPGRDVAEKLPQLALELGEAMAEARRRRPREREDGRDDVVLGALDEAAVAGLDAARALEARGDHDLLLSARALPPRLAEVAPDERRDLVVRRSRGGQRIVPRHAAVRRRVDAHPRAARLEHRLDDLRDALALHPVERLRERRHAERAEPCRKLLRAQV